MKKLIMMAATAALLGSVSMSTFAAGKSFEDRCKAQAEKHKVSTDKMDAYVKDCVEKHKKWMKHKHKHKKVEKKKEMKEAPKAEAPAAPAEPAN